MTALGLLGGAVLLVVNALFVALQFALVASRRSVLEDLAAEGDARARRALDRTSRLDEHLSGTQLAITVASLALGAVAVPALADVVGAALGPIGLGDTAERAVAVAVALAVVVVVDVVAAELVPKSIAIARPESVLLALSRLDRAHTAVFGWVARALDAVARVVARGLGVPSRPRLATAHTADELARLLAESRQQGVLEQTAHDLLAGALDLGGRDVSSILVPADRVTSVALTSTVAEAEAAIAASGARRLLVRDVAGTVIGFLRAKDLLTVPPGGRDRPLPVSRIRRVLVLAPTVPLDTVLVAMRRSRTHVGTVVDAGRRFCGIVTLEDVLEAIVERPS